MRPDLKKPQLRERPSIIVLSESALKSNLENRLCLWFDKLSLVNWREVQIWSLDVTETQKLPHLQVLSKSEIRSADLLSSSVICDLISWSERERERGYQMPPSSSPMPIYCLRSLLFLLHRLYLYPSSSLCCTLSFSIAHLLAHFLHLPPPFPLFSSLPVSPSICLIQWLGLWLAAVWFLWSPSEYTVTLDIIHRQ